MNWSPWARATVVRNEPARVAQHAVRFRPPAAGLPNLERAPPAFPGNPSLLAEFRLWPASARPTRHERDDSRVACSS